MTESARNLLFNLFILGKNTDREWATEEGLKLIASRDHKLAEELRAPMSCGHPKACEVPDQRTDKCDVMRHRLSYSLCPGCIPGHCTACAEIAAAEEAGYERGWSDSHEPVSTLRDGKGALAEHVAEKVTTAVSEMRERAIPSREELAKFIFEFECKPGDAQWPSDSAIQPYCRWAYREADKWHSFLSDVPLSAPPEAGGEK